MDFDLLLASEGIQIDRASVRVSPEQPSWVTEVGLAEPPTSAADVELLAAYLAHVSAVRGVPAVLRTSQDQLPQPASFQHY